MQHFYYFNKGQGFQCHGSRKVFENVQDGSAALLKIQSMFFFKKT